MRLSETIRLGAMLRPQGFIFGAMATSCALEAAAEAVGRFNEDWTICGAIWPWIEVETDASICPHGCNWLLTTENVIWHLNDDHKWTREAIADWVQTIEPPETPPSIERTPDEVFAVQCCYSRRGSPRTECKRRRR